MRHSGGLTPDDRTREWPPGERDEIRVYSFCVRLRPLRLGFEPGETAEIEVRVTRPLAGYCPVHDAAVVVGLSIGASFYYYETHTGQDGVTLATIALARETPRRPVAAEAYALKTIVSHRRRAVIHEYGFARSEGLFQIFK